MFLCKTKKMFEKQRLEARKKLLNSKDLLNFENVPPFIIDSFFGKCTYQTRLIVSTFCFLNGLSCSQCLEISRWRDISKNDINKINSFYQYLEKEENKKRYYSFSVHYRKVIFLNGDLRLYGKRIVNHNLFQC